MSNLNSGVYNANQKVSKYMIIWYKLNLYSLIYFIDTSPTFEKLNRLSDKLTVINVK